jgi:uncharacterized protein YtpQ (UPF0354 family)
MAHHKTRGHMGYLPNESDDFADQVVGMLRRMQPDFSIELTGPRELIVNGRRLDLENLYRLVNHDPERGEEIIEHYLDQLFSAEATAMATMGLDVLRSRIMPRIQPESIFQHLAREQVAHVPFVNGTVIVFVLDMPQMTVSVTTEQMVRWGVRNEDLDEIARENLRETSLELELQLVQSREGGRAIIVAQQDGYDAARLLLDNLWTRLAPKLGSEFYVATPARDMFVAFTTRPEPFVNRLRARISEDYLRLPYPISRDLFLVTRDGVAGTIEHESTSEAA